MQLPQVQYDVLRALEGAPGPMPVAALSERLRLDQSPVVAACTALQQQGYLIVEEREFEEFSLGKEAEAYLASPLPERRIIEALRKAGGRSRITELPGSTGLTSAQIGQSLRLLALRGWADKQGDELVLRGDADTGPQADERLLQALAAGPATQDSLRQTGIDVAAAVELLKPRRGFVNIKQRTARSVLLSDAGRKLLAGGVSGRRSVTQLTPELLADGGWRDVDIQPYDVTLAAKHIYPGKEHPFQRIMDKVRRVFLEMGFVEIVSPWVESSFWDFDALFQPQDHPARDMQDTFYVARPEVSRLPDEALVERVRAAHENGGDTGSTGWGYRWRRDLAAKPVLRTHTTAATIRALAAHAAQVGREQPANSTASTDAAASAGGCWRSHVPTFQPSHSACPPGKYFVIGPVFRRETVDYKHLPVFHQVDGIIVDPHASLCTLLGTLKAFYHKMGFADVHINPSFYPYTEPSAEVQVYYEKKGDWVEMGGSGIFRPEVTRPLGITDRVLAWGLGLERLAMMVHDLPAIGDLYFPTMPWLRETPLCRS